MLPCTKQLLAGESTHLDVVDGGIDDLLAIVARVVDVDALELCVEQLLGYVVHQRYADTFRQPQLQLKRCQIPVYVLVRCRFKFHRSMPSSNREKLVK